MSHLGTFQLAQTSFLNGVPRPYIQAILYSSLTTSPTRFKLIPSPRLLSSGFLFPTTSTVSTSVKILYVQTDGHLTAWHAPSLLSTVHGAFPIYPPPTLAHPLFSHHSALSHAPMTPADMQTRNRMEILAGWHRMRFPSYSNQPVPL